jgi:hypothetical protein
MIGRQRGCGKCRMIGRIDPVQATREHKPAALARVVAADDPAAEEMPINTAGAVMTASATRAFFPIMGAGSSLLPDANRDRI